MPKRVTAWYDRKWLVPTFAFLTFVSMPFREDIREAALAGVGVILGDWLFDFLLTGALIGLAAVLIFKSDRATRACEDLREQLQEDLANHRTQLNTDLADHRKQLQEELPALVDTKLKPISDAIATLESSVSALGSLTDLATERDSVSIHAAPRSLEPRKKLCALLTSYPTPAPSSE